MPGTLFLLLTVATSDCVSMPRLTYQVSCFMIHVTVTLSDDNLRSESAALAVVSLGLDRFVPTLTPVQVLPLSRH